MTLEKRVKRLEEQMGGGQQTIIFVKSFMLPLELGYSPLPSEIDKGLLHLVSHHPQARDLALYEPEAEDFQAGRFACSKCRQEGKSHEHN